MFRGGEEGEKKNNRFSLSQLLLNINGDNCLSFAVGSCVSVVFPSSPRNHNEIKQYRISFRSDNGTRVCLKQNRYHSTLH